MITNLDDVDELVTNVDEIANVQRVCTGKRRGVRVFCAFQMLSQLYLLAAIDCLGEFAYVWNREIFSRYQ